MNCGQNARTLRALKHIYSKGEVGQTVAMMVVAESKGFLEYAAREVPQCQEDSAQLLQWFSLSARRWRPFQQQQRNQRL